MGFFGLMFLQVYLYHIYIYICMFGWCTLICAVNVTFSIHFYSISRPCPSIAQNSPPPGSSNFLCPSLSLSIPLPVAPQCHFSNQDFGLPTDLMPFIFGRFVQPISILYWIWTVSVTLILCLLTVTLASFAEIIINLSFVTILKNCEFTV